LETVSNITGGTTKASYVWLADGKKCGVKDGTAANGFEYLGSLIYKKENGVLSLEQALFSEGTIKAASGGQEIDYFYKDHLGSVRAVVDATGTIKQRSDYLPFGMRMDKSDYQNNDNRLQFNGKEKQITGNIMSGFALDYGARMYDSWLVRWKAGDPLAHLTPSVSIYAYCGNNPVSRIDPTGMIWDDEQDAERLKRDADNEISSLNKYISKTQAAIDKGGLSDKQAARLQGEISDAKNRISNLETSKADIDKLGADQDHTYALSNVSDGEHHVRQGDDGKVYIETSSNALSLHEISHVRQSLDAGGLRFSTDGNSYLLNSGTGIVSAARNEVEGYKMQYSLDQSFPGNLHGQGLQGINVNSVGDIKNNNGAYVYPLIHQYSVDLEKSIQQQKRLINEGK